MHVSVAGIAAIAALGADAAVFAEPAAAAAYAGLERARVGGIVPAGAEVVTLVTGNGLKDVAAATRAARHVAPVIDPTLDALRAALGV